MTKQTSRAVKAVARTSASRKIRRPSTVTLPTEPQTERDKDTPQAILAKFFHERFFQSLAYRQFLTQRADQAIQTYLTVLTAIIGVFIVIWTSTLGQTPEILWGAFAAVLFVIGVVGIVTALRFTAYRRMRSYEKNRIAQLQRYFADLDAAAFDKYEFRLQETPVTFNYWYNPFLWAFGILHAGLPSVALGIVLAILSSPPGYSVSQNLWWILILSGLACFASIFFYIRLHNNLSR